ncbi:uncharacterized protein F5Z01DRAFT_675391 [Emericellopsis atlantica]|uniref:Uncharacterized protein n=1 Tax=Emericellopsis atlantica TaxID=2614577 RepID=A0A9P8CNC0_9HYPO|nr:uncharacterized protein F5Z01DRAFT_675391 [Emericellopsis atlantica]KAG9252987.1 hypothetical protein F5Z01DRAFT_675391 [Emericellopsis atlantica]
MFGKHASLLALLAVPFAYAETPLCLDPAGLRGVELYDYAYYREVPDGRTLAFCYNVGQNDWVIDNNWITDIDAMLTTLVNLNGAARCVDCLPSAEPAGCTGYSKIWNIDGNDPIADLFGTDLPPLDTYSKDVFMDIVRDMAADGVRLEAFGDELSPALTIDKPGQLREQTYNIFGDGDTC